MYLVPKKKGDWRIYDDYRRNKVQVPGRYPIPHLHDIAYLEDCTIFTTIDLIRVYHQIPVTEEDRPKTAMITLFGLFEYNMMPFGL